MFSMQSETTFFKLWNLYVYVFQIKNSVIYAKLTTTNRH